MLLRRTINGAGPNVKIIRSNGVPGFVNEPPSNSFSCLFGI